MEELLVDVRSHTQFLKKRIKRAINIPVEEIEFHKEILKEFSKIKKLALYCDTGYESKIAKKKLEEMGIDARIIPTEELKNYEWEGNEVISAVNYVSVRPGHEKEFEKRVRELCSATKTFPGFLGSQFLRVSGMSAIGSGLPGELRDMNIEPTKYLIITYWNSKEMHDDSHTKEVFQNAFKEMLGHISKMPYEEFYEILR